MRNSRLFRYLFVEKDPRLMAMPNRKLLGSAMMAAGTVQAVIGLLYLTGVVQ